MKRGRSREDDPGDDGEVVLEEGARVVEIGPIRVGPGAPLALIAGPCVIEGRDFLLRHAEHLATLAARWGFPFVLKASFDKANRTRRDAFRGPGLEAGLRILEEARQTLGVPVLTDVHEPTQCGPVAEVVDALQIPAFLCRQTDLLTAAGATGRPVNVKKAQHAEPDAMAHALDKVAAARPAGGPPAVLLTERGTFFGYRDLVVDFRGFASMRRIAPLVFDGTHAVQRPGGLGGASGGDRREVPALVRAAVAVGVDGLFLEVHPKPDRALSDGPSSLDPSLFEEVLVDVRRIRGALGAG